MLTQENLQSLLNYCPDTGVFTNIKARKKVRVGEVSGYVHHTGYVRIKIDGKLYRAHRLAWMYIHGNFPPEQIDHINRDRADNRICNLRLATNAENQQNTSIRSDNTSGHAGVSWRKDAKKWHARIRINYKDINLGNFSDLSEAIAARKAAEQKYFIFQNA